MDDNMAVDKVEDPQIQSDMDLEPILGDDTESDSNADSKTKSNFGRSVMAVGSVAVNSVSAFLHPLVIMNISEHWTRLRAKHNRPQPIYGALIGKQKGRSIEIMNSFELVWEDKKENKVVLDHGYYTHKEEQFKQVFPDLDFLGWYTAGDTPTEQDIEFHRQICEINESPVLLKLNPFNSTSKLPIRMFESVIDLVDGTATMLFVEISYTLATEEAERIGLDHMAKLSSSQQSGQDHSSVVAEHLRCQYNAVKMLRDRVKLVHDYAKEVQTGELPVNHEILRDAYNLCHRLPVINSNNSAFNEDFYNQYNDVALLTYLGIVTKATNSTNQFVNKFDVLLDRQTIGRRVRPAYP